MSIAENLLYIKERIDKACSKSGRSTDDVKLIAVTKTIGVERIKEAISCGIKRFGENKVQEIVDKYPQIDSNVEWHMIGHLQTNKVKYITDKVSMIHSVDSIKLAEEINKRFKNSGRIIDILVEINIGMEESKHGIDPNYVLEFIREVSNYDSIKVCGLMTVAPAVDDTDKARPYFRRMKEIFDYVKSNSIYNVDMKYLSMGMTGDYEVAIEEGANIVRIGSGIFGPRNYETTSL